MSDPSRPRIYVRSVRLSGWRAVVAVAAGITALVAVTAFLALGFLFIALPALAIASIAYYLLPKRPNRALGSSNSAERSGNTTITDVTYRVTHDDAGDAESDD